LKLLNNKAFSLIELIFVILIIAIISSIAIPKLLNTTSKANIIKCKNDLSIIQNALNNYKINLNMKNKTNTLNTLDDGTYLFEKILQNPILSSSKQWSKKSSTIYTYNFQDNSKVNFIYNKNDLTFLCDKTKDLCKDILK